MKLKARPYAPIAISVSDGSPLEVSAATLEKFAERWPTMWPLYHRVIMMLFSQYDSEDLFMKKRTRVSIAKLTPRKKDNHGADLLVRFAFDRTGITWDIFQKGMTIVHAQPAF